jgi:hypothetical protein
MRITLGTLKRIIRETVNEQMMGPEHFYKDETDPLTPGTTANRAKLRADVEASDRGSHADPMGLAKHQAAQIRLALGRAKNGAEMAAAAGQAHALATKMGPDFAMSHFGKSIELLEKLASLA